MKKIKLFTAVVVVTSLLGITSFAAIVPSTKGVQKLDSADLMAVLNNNADVLENHIDKVAGTDTQGHIKIGQGLEMTGEGEVKDVANVKIGTGLQMTDGAVSAKIADNLKTNESETALSA